MSAPIRSNSVAGGPSEPNKYSVDDSGVEIATGEPAAGGLYLSGLAGEGVARRREILRFLTRLRSQSGLAPVDFTRYTTMLSQGRGPVGRLGPTDVLAQEDALLTSPPERTCVARRASAVRNA